MMKPRDKRIKEYQRAGAALEVRKTYFQPNEEKYHCDQQAMGRLNCIVPKRCSGFQTLKITKCGN